MCRQSGPQVGSRTRRPRPDSTHESAQRGVPLRLRRTCGLRYQRNGSVEAPDYSYPSVFAYRAMEHSCNVSGQWAVFSNGRVERELEVAEFSLLYAVLTPWRAFEVNRTRRSPHSTVSNRLCVPAVYPSGGTSPISSARFSNRVCACRNTRSIFPIGPLRCLARINSARPFRSSRSRW